MRRSDLTFIFPSPCAGQAQQGARANVHIGHAACYRLHFRNEAFDREPFRCTQRARCGRGSSLTFGKKSASGAGNKEQRTSGERGVDERVGGVRHRWLRSSIGMLALVEEIGPFRFVRHVVGAFPSLHPRSQPKGCFSFGRFCRARDWQHWRKSIASWLRGVRNPKLAEQGARANAGICHAACDRRSFEMKLQKVNRDAARGAPAPGVAHL